MPIILRNLAKVEIPKEHKYNVLKRYTYENYSGDIVCNYLYKSASNLAYLPPNMWKLKEVSRLLGEEIIDQRSDGEPLSEPFVQNTDFNFRPHQTDSANELLCFVMENQYAVLEAGCGTGKTIVNTWVAGQLGKRVLVLVDQGMLAEQWKEAFHTVYNREAQVLNSKNCNEFADVVVATFQFLNKNPDVVQRMAESFGVLVLDEFHSTAATTYRNVLYRLNNKYRIGTTATLLRKGYTHEVLTDLVANVSVTMVDENALVPEVYFIDTGIPLVSNNPDEFTTILSELSANDQRNNLILSILREQIEEERKILFIGARTESLKNLSKQASKFCNTNLFVGTTTLKQDTALKEGVADGSIQIVFSERKVEKGVDIPRLDTLVLAKLMNNEATVSQIAGRILRQCEGKPVPRIYDLVDSGSLADRFAKNRMKWYRQRGYKIIDTESKIRLDKISLRY